MQARSVPRMKRRIVLGMPDDAGAEVKTLFLNQALNLQNMQNVQEGIPIIKHGSFLFLIAKCLPGLLLTCVTCAPSANEDTSTSKGIFSDFLVRR